MQLCPNCGASIKAGAKFCSKCGYQVQPVAEMTPNKSQDERLRLSKSASTPARVIASPLPAQRVPLTTASPSRIDVQSVSTDAYDDNPSEIAWWKWNWGAFFWPGVWPLVYRIKPRVVPVVLGWIVIGLPLIAAAIATGSHITRAHASEISEAAGRSAISGSYYGFDTPSPFYWYAAASAAKVLLIFYALACLSSIRSARQGSLEAWRQFSNTNGTNVKSFKVAQRVWAFSGVLLCSALIGMICYASANYNRTHQAQIEAVNRELRLQQTFWVFQGSAEPWSSYRFYFPADSQGNNCSISWVNGKRVNGQFQLIGDRLTVSSKDAGYGIHVFSLSKDEQTLTELNTNSSHGGIVLQRSGAAEGSGG